MLGLGAMIHHLGGGTKKNVSDYYGKTIAKAEADGDTLVLTFDDGVAIVISDEGQSCCEHRYMNVEDDLNSLVGQKLVAVEVNHADDIEKEYGDVHEIAFLDVKTDQQVVQFSFHNEHNGYYGGFGLNVSEKANG